TAGQYFTNDQIKEMTRKVSAEVDLVHQQTQNQRYGSSHIGATAKDIYDADNRPLLVMRSNLWASGYDVDGTDQTSLGQFSGRVQQTYKHSVPRFFVPEHGTMFTLALVRFPPTATKEIQYLNAKGALTYTDI